MAIELVFSLKRNRNSITGASMPHDLTSGQNQMCIHQWNKVYRMHCML